MQDLHATIVLRNGHLVRRRQDAGLTTKEMAKKIGIPQPVYVGLENMTRSPLMRKFSTVFTHEALAVASYFCVAAKDLFPERVCNISQDQHEMTRAMDAEYLPAFLGLTAPATPVKKRL